jgi:hypothetical protein
LAALQRIYLRCISALLVLVVERRADAIADEAAKDATNRCAGDTISRPATGDRCTKQRTCARTD